MKILLFTPQLPYPPHQGTTIRNFYLIAYLARHHTIDLVTFLAPGQKLQVDSPLHTLCRMIETIPQPTRSTKERARTALTSLLPDMALRLESVAMRNLVASLATDYDIIQFEGIEMAQYGRQARNQSRAAGQRPLLVFDDHNCEYLLQKRHALTDLRHPKRWLAGAYSLLQWRKLRRYEGVICRDASLVTAVSGPDKAALEALVPGLTVTVMANGIAPEEYQPVEPAAQALQTPWKLVFTGKMDYRPNVDAMLWFAEEVLPLIQAKEAAVRLQIVGMNPHPRLDHLRANPAIEITGAVASIQPYLAAAAVYIVPLRVGGGTRFKVLEAMAQGLPMVSTPLGVEGIGVTNEAELLLASSPGDFAAAVLRLLTDRRRGGVLCTAIGRRARAFVEAHYSWESIVPQLEARYIALQEKS
ncbi:MAG TPA: glycosyltransferase [Caldilineaceae bacterium]|nr:glycosyltransferase [Caldilineaceae bacterium]